MVVTGYLLSDHTPKIHVLKKSEPVFTTFPATDQSQILTVDASGIEDNILKFSARWLKLKVVRRAIY